MKNKGLIIIAGIVILLSFFMTGFDLTGMSILEWDTNNLTLPMSGGQVDLAEVINASDFLIATTSLNATINGTTLTIGPTAAGQYTLEITATKDGQVSTNELIITIQAPQEEAVTLDFVNALSEPQFTVDFWSHSIGGDVQIELSHRGNESQSVWGDNATVSTGIAQPGEKIMVNVPLNTTATVYIGLNGAAYGIDTRGLSPEAQPQVQTPKQSEAVKTQKNEAVGKKVEEDANFDTHFVNVTKEENRLLIQFYHDSTLSQPVWIEGSIDYTLSTETAAPQETVILSVPLVKGNIPRFKLHVGATSEVFEFGTTSTGGLSLTVDPTIRGYGRNVTILADANETGTITIDVLRPDGQTRSFQNTGTTFELQYNDFLNGTYSVQASADTASGILTANSTFNLRAKELNGIRVNKKIYNQSETVWLFDVPGINLSVDWKLGVIGNFSPAQIPTDIVWVVDRSGSMARIQQAIADDSQTFANELAASGLDYRLAVTCYLGDTTLQQDFTQNLADFNEAVTTCGSSGGLENGFRALNKTLQGLNLSYRDGAKKVFILVSNEGADDYYRPAGDVATFGSTIGPFPERLEEMKQTLLNAGVFVFGITDRYDVLHGYEIQEYPAIYTATGGRNYPRQEEDDFGELMYGLAEEIGRTVTLKTRKLDGNTIFRQLIVQAGNKTAEEIIREDIALGGSQFPSNFFEDQADNIYKYFIEILNASGYNGTENVNVDTRLIQSYFIHDEHGKVQGTQVDLVRNSTVHFYYPNETLVSKIHNNASPYNITGKLVLTVERLVGTEFVHHFTVLNESQTTKTTTILPGYTHELLLKPIWDSEGGMPTHGSPGGKYRARARLYDREIGTNLLVDSHGDPIDTTDNFTIIDNSRTCPIDVGESMTLQQNYVGNGSGYCFNITESNITLNCNGHIVNATLSGDSGADYGLGTVISTGTSDITIINCSFTNWNRGFYLRNVTDAQIHNNVIEQSNETGIALMDSEDIGVSKNNILTQQGRRAYHPELGRGVLVHGGRNTTIFNIAVNTAGNDGVMIRNNHDSSVRSSNIITTSNDTAVIFSGSSRGTVENNHLEGSEMGRAALMIFNSQVIQAQNNTAIGGGKSDLLGSAGQLEGAAITIRRSDNVTATDNLIPPHYYGIAIQGGSHNRLLNNTISSTLAGFIIRPYPSFTSIVAVRDTLVEGNYVNITAGNGMRVGPHTITNIYYAPRERASVENLHVQHNTFTSSAISSFGIEFTHVDNSTIYQNEINTDDSAIFVRGDIFTGTGGSFGKNVSILENNVQVRRRGIILDEMRESIAANNTVRAVGTGIDITNEQSSNLTIADNEIYILTGTGVNTKTGISIGDKPQDILLLRNTIDINGSNSEAATNGIVSRGRNNIDTINNTIILRKPAYQAITYGYNAGKYRDITGNEITIHQGAKGIRLEGMEDSRVEKNKIRLLSGSGEGINNEDSSPTSSNVTYAGNDIQMNGSSLKGIGVFCVQCVVDSNTIVLNGSSAKGIQLLRSKLVNNNTIQTHGGGGGIAYGGISSFEVPTVSNNTILTDGYNAPGITTTVNSYIRSLTVLGNKITTKGTYSAGILVQRLTGSNINNNVFDTYGTNSPGIQLNQVAYQTKDNQFKNNNITVRQNSNAIDFNGYVYNHAFKNTRVAALGSGNEWDVSQSPSLNLTADNLYFTRTGVLVTELETQNTTGIKGLLPEEAASLGVPPKHASLDKFFNTTGNSPTSWGAKSIININISYTDAEFAATPINDEAALRVWRFNTGWENTTFYDLNTADPANNIVSSIIRDFGTIGIFGPTPVTLEKSADDTTLLPGQVTNYTIFVQNNAGPLSSISITDILPQELAFISSQPAPSTTSGQEYTWNFAGLQTNEAQTIIVTVQVDRNAQPGDHLANIVHFTAFNGTENIEENDTINVSIVSPLIKVRKEASSKTAIPNTTVNYTITVSNIGNATLYNATVKEIMPDTMLYVTSTPVPYSIAPLEWRYSAIEPHTTETIKLTVLLNASLLDGDKLTNYVEVDGHDEVDNNESGDTNSTINITTARVEISVTPSNNTVLPNKTVDLNVQVRNAQNLALNVTVGQLLPYGLEYVHSTRAPIANNTYEILNLAPGASSTFVVTVRSNYTLPDLTDLASFYNATGKDVRVPTPTVNDTATVTYISPPSAIVSLRSTEGGNPKPDSTLVADTEITDASNDGTKNITTWYVDGEALQVLYLGFEAGSTTRTSARDYAYGNNAIIEGATFNPEAGFDGFGALEFDGTSEVRVPDSNALDLENFTITLYVQDPVSGAGENITVTEVTGTTSYNAEGCPTSIPGQSYSYTDDGVHGPFQLGFEATFFNQTVSEVYMDTNGRLMFDYDYSSYTPSTHYMESGGTRIVAPAWDDYGGSSYNNEYVCVNQSSSPNKYAVFRWDSEWYSGNGQVQTEVVLTESGKILLRYGTMTDSYYDGLVIKGISMGNGKDYNYTTLFHQSGPQPSTLAHRAFEITFEPPAPAARTVINKNGSYAIEITGGEGNFTLQGYINGDNTTRVESAIDKNMTFIALSYDGNDLQLYKNGALVDNKTIGTSVMLTADDLTIGNNLLGVIDDVVIYNRPLSQEQISLLWQNKTEIIHPAETLEGEEWFARVTPNDGFRDGRTAQSNNLTIQPATQCTEYTVTYQTEVKDKIVKYENAPIGLGEERKVESDIFTIPVSGTSAEIKVQTKAATGRADTILKNEGDSFVDENGFEIRLLEITGSSYIIQVTSIENRHALSYVEFTFDTTVLLPGGPETVIRVDCGQPGTGDDGSDDGGDDSQDDTGTEGTVTYTTEVKKGSVKFEGAPVGLGEEKLKQTDVFTIPVSGTSTQVEITTKAGRPRAHSSLQAIGDTVLDGNGFDIALQNISNGAYTIAVTSEENEHALSYVEFDFGKQATVLLESGNMQIVRIDYDSSGNLITGAFAVETAGDYSDHLQMFLLLAFLGCVYGLARKVRWGRAFYRR